MRLSIFFLSQARHVRYARYGEPLLEVAAIFHSCTKISNITRVLARTTNICGARRHRTTNRIKGGELVLVSNVTLGGLTRKTFHVVITIYFMSIHPSVRPSDRLSVRPFFRHPSFIFISIFGGFVHQLLY